MIYIFATIALPASSDPGAVFRAKRVCPAPLAPSSSPDASRAQFAPNLGASPGLQDPVCIKNPNGDRLSQVKAGVRIPCDCPPAQSDFARQFAIDHGTAISTGNAKQDQINNLQLGIITLQRSFCCPAGSVTLNAQLTAVQNGQAAPAPAPAPPANNPAPAPNPPAQSSNGQDPGAVFRAKRVCPAPLAPSSSPDASRAQFAPNLGASPGLQDPVCIKNPNGDRLSQVKAGVRIPCDCPPAQSDFARQFAIDHGTAISTGNAKQDQINNLQLGIITLQRSFCCPAGSVTLNAQLASL
ncbi:hypothetical protein HK103_006683 [Boothiomyces macroporosus]|uniref:Uncharacterized protein n=1 Tax=Boothiomyces macroporosus TaxID=261099 RepID=A0AAD5UD55_9FUNG|nr:hypothetical protein HK103_006683 [Boothiomyces macroporosus]